jgi:hypothetical protein
VAALVLGAGVLVWALGLLDTDDSRGAPGPSTGARIVQTSGVSAALTASATSAARWRDVLSRLDTIRARAWSRDEPRLLRRVYTHRSAALSRDRAMLVAYERRGLRVRGVHLAFDRIIVTARAAGVVRLRVVDRLGRMTAFGRSGLRLPLPRDNPSRQVVVLRRSGGAWRIDRVQAV